MSEALYNELQKPAYSNKTDNEIVAMLNAPDGVEYSIQPATPDITNFLMNTGLYAKLIAVYRTHPVPEIRVAAECALDLAQSQIPFVNLENPNIQTMMGALVAGGVWTQAEADYVKDFGKARKSIAEDLLQRVATLEDVTVARQWPRIVQFGQLHSAAAAACNEVMDYVQVQRADVLSGSYVPSVQNIVALFEVHLAAQLSTQNAS